MSQSSIESLLEISQDLPGLRVITYDTEMEGPLGPQSVDTDRLSRLWRVAASGLLVRKASNISTCPDARPNVDEPESILSTDQFAEILSRESDRSELDIVHNALRAVSVETADAPMRTFGCRSVRETGIDLMVPASARYNVGLDDQGATLDTHVEQNSIIMAMKESVQAPRVHGDNHGVHKLAGCGANGLMVRVMKRPVFDESYKDELIDKAGATLSRLNIDTAADELETLLMNGADYMIDDSFVSDSTAENRALAALEAGAVYETRNGAHDEWGLVEYLGEDSLAGRAYSQVFGDQVFIVTTGANVAHTSATREKYSLEKDAARARACAGVLLDTAFIMNASNSNLIHAQLDGIVR